MIIVPKMDFFMWYYVVDCFVGRVVCISLQKTLYLLLPKGAKLRLKNEKQNNNQIKL